MIVRDTRLRFHRLQERLGDPLLTVLTILLALLLFVIAPLHAAGIVLSQDVGLAVALVSSSRSCSPTESRLPLS